VWCAEGSTQQFKDSNQLEVKYSLQRTLRVSNEEQQQQQKNSLLLQEVVTVVYCTIL
jgi:hypothetical protein